jgi:hypothetical protein
MKTTTLMLLMAALWLPGCALFPQPVSTAIQAPPPERCVSPTYEKQQHAFRCGAIVYDLMQPPVRSRRVFDFLSRETFTRRHFVVRSGGRRYVFKAVQLAGERHPRTVLLETPGGFVRLQLDGAGNVVASERAADLSG